MANFDDIRGVPQGIGSLTRIPQNVRPILSQQPTTAPVQIAGSAGAGLNLPTSLPNNPFPYIDPRSIDPFAVQPLGSIDYASAFSRQPVAGMQTVDMAPTIKMPIPTTEEELTTEQKIQKAFEEGDITETELEARIKALAEIRKEPTKEKEPEPSPQKDPYEFLNEFLKTVPSLSADEIKTKVAERAAMFKDVLEMDDNNSKYLTFLEVAKSGLKLAGGKGDKSFLQNFAEAFEDLPTFLQKIAITENQQDKALKMQALNLVLEEEKRAQLAPLERFKALPEKVRTALASGIDPASKEFKDYIQGLKEPDKISMYKFMLENGLVDPNDKTFAMELFSGISQKDKDGEDMPFGKTARGYHLANINKYGDDFISGDITPNNLKILQTSLSELYNAEKVGIYNSSSGAYEKEQMPPIARQLINRGAYTPTEEPKQSYKDIELETIPEEEAISVYGSVGTRGAAKNVINTIAEAFLQRQPFENVDEGKNVIEDLGISTKIIVKDAFRGRDTVTILNMLDQLTPKAAEITAGPERTAQRFEDTAKYMEDLLRDLQDTVDNPSLYKPESIEGARINIPKLERLVKDHYALGATLRAALQENRPPLSSFYKNSTT